jgi:predicted metal-dependent TIM-barrel fold hydrolase
MRMFDPHIHMTSRTTDDYQAMATAGIAAIVEPAFWLGQPRTHVGTSAPWASILRRPTAQTSRRAS